MACTTENAIKELSAVTGLDIKIGDGYGATVKNMVKIGEEYAPIRQTYAEATTEAKAGTRAEGTITDIKEIPETILNRKDNIHSQTKEYKKSLIATQFIGDGTRKRFKGDGRSSTAFYQDIYDDIELANTGEYTKDDIIFVSSNGMTVNKKTGKESAHVKAIDEKGKLLGEYENLQKAIDSGSTIVMDTKKNAKKPFNKIGEGRLYDFMLKQDGYVPHEVIQDGWYSITKDTKGNETKVPYGYTMWINTKKQTLKQQEGLVALPAKMDGDTTPEVHPTQGDKKTTEKKSTTTPKVTIKKGTKVTVGKGKTEYTVVKYIPKQKKWQIETKDKKKYNKYKSELNIVKPKAKTTKVKKTTTKEPVTYKNKFKVGDELTLTNKDGKVFDFRVIETLDNGKIKVYSYTAKKDGIVERNPDLFTLKETPVVNTGSDQEKKENDAKTTSKISNNTKNQTTKSSTDTNKEEDLIKDIKKLQEKCKE